MTVKLYKFVSDGDTTRNETKWSLGIWNEAKGEGTSLCSDGLLHGYTHPYLAVFAKPIHVDSSYTKLIEVESSEIIASDGLKSGSKRQRKLQDVVSIALTTKQRVEIAIRVVLETCMNLPKSWVVWGEDWLNGMNITAADARAARYAAAAAEYAARAAEYAAEYAADDAARAAEYAAGAAGAAARAAEYAADARGAAGAAARAAEYAADAARAAEYAAHDAARAAEYAAEYAAADEFSSRLIEIIKNVYCNGN